MKKFVWLASLLALVFTLGCGAKAHHVAVLADATFVQAVFAVDDAEFAACKSGVLTPAVCAAANPKIKQALLDVKGVTAAIQLSPNLTTLPKDLPSLIKSLTEVQSLLAPLTPNPLKDDLSTKISAALAKAVAVLSLFVGAL